MGVFCQYEQKGECMQNHLENCGLKHALKQIFGKYKIEIMYNLLHSEVLRYNELKRAVGDVSFKSLTRALKELESDGLIIRTKYPVIPPKVEYRLSEKGQTLVPIMKMLCKWGIENK